MSPQTPPASNSPPSHEDRRKKRLPQDYADAVSEHSTRAKEHSLHPGIHYRPFALFLNGNSYNSPKSRRTCLGQRAHIFAAIHNFAYEPEDPRRITFFDSVKSLDDFAAYPLPHNGCGQLLFLRGYPSHKWVNLVGVRYRVDPEFFRRHLSFSQNSDFYDIPAPASSSQNIVKLSITSIGKRSATSVKQHGEKQSLLEYFENIGSNPDVVGESIVRRFSVHDQARFSIEQDISFCVLKRGKGWIGIILLDTGRDLDDGPAGPWLDSTSQPRGFDNVFNPVIQFEPNICFKETEKIQGETQPHGAQLAHKRRFRQSSSLLHTKSYGRFMSPALMKTDAFYALHELFNFAACSESHFLNLMKSKFESETDLHNQEEHMQQSLLDLKHHKFILHEHIEQLQSAIAIIKQGGNSTWPRAKSIPDSPRLLSAARSPRDAKPQIVLTTLTSATPAPQPDTTMQSLTESESDRATQRLLRDYECLLHRAQSLSDLYSEGMRDIRNNAMLAESRKAIEQARGVARLTLLAYFFIPLSFTTSLFGMNFKELGTQLSIWVWVAVSVPVFVVALVLCFWNKLAPVILRLRPALATTPRR